MKRYGILLIMSLLVLCMASASYAIFPGTQFGTVGPNTAGDGTVDIQLSQGWVNGFVAWYSCFATNDIRTAQTQNLTLSQPLSLATFSTANWMYVVTNNTNFGPVFSYAPPGPPYTGIWAVQYITWRPGQPRWVITDATGGITGVPPGLPNATQAYYSTSPIPPFPLPPIQILGPNGLLPGPGFTILDCPIFAVGQISNPWRKIAAGIYRIPQGRWVNTYTKKLTIPFWYVYCRDHHTKAISTERIIIPDAADLGIATLIGANYAPLLNSATPPERNALFVFNWQQPFGPGQVWKVLANQWPVRSECPDPCGPGNLNRDYTPIATFITVNKLNVALAEVLFNNQEFILQQVGAGGLSLFGAPRFVVNAPVLCERGLY